MDKRGITLILYLMPSTTETLSWYFPHSLDEVSRCWRVRLSTYLSLLYLSVQLHDTTRLS